MKHDIAWLRAEISSLRTQLAQDTQDRSTADRLRLLKSALGRLEAKTAERQNPEESIQSISAHIADTGPVCSGYSYLLDGGHNPGMVGGMTWGEASVGPDGFSPPPPTYRSVAYSFVGTTDGYGNFSWDEEMDDQLGYAWVLASVDCGYSSWWCPTWESYNWIQSYGCSDGFRSIYRWGSN